MSVKFLNRTETGIETYELENRSGMRAQIITFGARLKSLFVRNGSGGLTDVLAGFDDPEEYRNDRGTYFGAIIGRVGNRIAKGEFCLDGKKYSLYKNDGNNHLHGGKEGFDKKLWSAHEAGENALKLDYFSKDGEEGYPGNLKVSVVYSLSEDNKLTISYSAISDKNTLCSFTNHAYFNLEGDFKTALNHEIYISADYLTDVDEELIPNGKLFAVKGTPLDFNAPKLLSKDIKADDRLLKIGRGGYDFNYVLNNDQENPVAYAYSEKSGIKMKVYSDRPCKQFYTGNFLDGFKGKTEYPYQSAFCMETQGYPNACNVPSFPSMEIKAGEEYKTETTYAFSIE